jgi:excisionase family DNA binding protein
MDALLTIENLGEKLGKRESWIRWAIRHRVLTFVKVGQQIRFRPADVEAYLAKRTVPSVTA